MTAAGSTTYQWDAANRLQSVNSGSLGSYGYDGNSKRVKKTEGGTTTYYVSSSVIGAAVMEVTSVGVQRAYVMSGGSVIAQLNPNGQFYWLHSDHLGSGRKMTDISGAMVYRAEFDPYGKLLYEWSAPANMNTKKFTGYERDAATGLDYAQARMYSSEWGRFMSPDPIGMKSANLNSPQSLNRYSYVKNNPINATDPSGLLTLLVHGTGDEPDAHEWALEGSDFWQAVYNTFGEIPQSFDWREFSSVFQVTAISGYYGIYAGAAKLVDFLNNYKFQEGEKLNLVAHSHGGNIIKLASYFLNRKIDNLVTLGTPQNDDLVKINSSAVRNHCNVSSIADYKQLGGSSPTQVYWFGYYTYWGGYHAAKAAYYFAQAFISLGNPYGGISPTSPPPSYYFSLAGQHTQAAGIAFGLATAWLMSTKVDVFANKNVILGSESHHDLITAPTWNSQVRSGCGL